MRQNKKQKPSTFIKTENNGFCFLLIKFFTLLYYYLFFKKSGTFSLLSLTPPIYEFPLSKMGFERL